MSVIIEQIAACVLFVAFMTAYIAAIFGFAVLCDRIKDWFLGVPRLSKNQRERIAMWRQTDRRGAGWIATRARMVIPSEAELLTSEAAFL